MALTAQEASLAKKWVAEGKNKDQVLELLDAHRRSNSNVSIAGESPEVTRVKEKQATSIVRPTAQESIQKSLSVDLKGALGMAEGAMKYIGSRDWSQFLDKLNPIGEQGLYGAGGEKIPAALKAIPEMVPKIPGVAKEMIGGALAEAPAAGGRLIKFGMNLGADVADLAVESFVPAVNTYKNLVKQRIINGEKISDFELRLVNTKTTDAARFIGEVAKKLGERGEQLAKEIGAEGKKPLKIGDKTYDMSWSSFDPDSAWGQIGRKLFLIGAATYIGTKILGHQTGIKGLATGPANIVKGPRLGTKVFNMKGSHPVLREGLDYAGNTWNDVAQVLEESVVRTGVMDALSTGKTTPGSLIAGAVIDLWIAGAIRAAKNRAYRRFSTGVQSQIPEELAVANKRLISYKNTVKRATERGWMAVDIESMQAKMSAYYDEANIRANEILETAIAKGDVWIDQDAYRDAMYRVVKNYYDQGNIDDAIYMFNKYNKIIPSKTTSGWKEKNVDWLIKFYRGTGDKELAEMFQEAVDLGLIKDTDIIPASGVIDLRTAKNLKEGANDLLKGFAGTGRETTGRTASEIQWAQNSKEELAPLMEEALGPEWVDYNNIAHDAYVLEKLSGLKAAQLEGVQQLGKEVSQSVFKSPSTIGTVTGWFSNEYARGLGNPVVPMIGRAAAPLPNAYQAFAPPSEEPAWKKYPSYIYTGKE